MIGLSICKQNYVSTAISKMASDMPRKLAVAHITQVLETAIQSLRYSLPALHLPRKQTDELIKALMMAAEQFKNVQDSAHPFTKYLKKEDRYVIEALITSELLTKSLTELLTSPAYLEYVLTRKTMTSQALDTT